MGEGRHQSERSVSKETRRRALVWRGPQAPMGLLGKGAGAQRRYTIERRYQRFLDSPWRTAVQHFYESQATPVHVSEYAACTRAAWLFCALCIASIHCLSAFSHFIPLNGDAFRLIVILCVFRERTVNICFLVCNIDSFQFQNSILLTELLLFSCDNSCLEFSWIQENSIERLL